jgi:hypothetical protein
MKRLFVQQCQNSDVRKANWWPAGSHLVMQVFAPWPNILALPPDAPLAVNNVSELCLETCVNVFGRDAVLADKPNDDSLWSDSIRRIKNGKRTYLATMTLNVLLM